jgi:hypothetical protein
MAEIIMLSKVRLSFPSLVEPRKPSTDPNASPKYNADFILSPNDAGFTSFMNEVNKVAMGKWLEHAQAVMQIINSDRKLRCYGQGSERIDSKTFKPYNGYEGMVYISASRPGDQPPQMIQADGRPVDPVNTMAYQAIARKMYGGCYVNAAVRPWAQQNTHGRGIRCDLIAIQFAADGEPFGEAQPDATGLFGAVATSSQQPQVPAFGAPAFGSPTVPSFLGG